MQLTRLYIIQKLRFNSEFLESNAMTNISMSMFWMGFET